LGQYSGRDSGSIIMRVTFAIPSLGSGGAERVLTILANTWASKGWEVTIISLNNEEWDSFFEVDRRIRWVRLGLLKEAANPLAGMWNNVQRVRALRRAICQSSPQVVISFIDTMNVLVLAAAGSLDIPVVISERSDPMKHPIGTVWNRLRRWTYPSASRLVVLSQAARVFFKGLPGEKLCIIPNPILGVPVVEGETPYLTHRPVVLTAGRLSREKGCDLLIRAFAMSRERYPDWNLLILGDGAQRNELEGLVDELGMKQCISLPGRVKNPYDYFRKGDLFVLPSRYEGLPNALCEAMVCGMAVVAANCSPGVAEVVQDGVNGLLAQPENVDSLAAAMQQLMGDKTRRASLGEEASLSMQPYRLDRVMTQWEDLIRELTE
jgi:GalNAc-alpha-(1->4)-GalNAc-alpha-(1->3)-diNAcBac-PP-undecaprenol alpha-1,4-N-acetyl-D-galactosaminyltransferase